MATGRDFFGTLKPLGGAVVSCKKCLHGASVLYPRGRCHEPATVWYKGWSSGTTQLPDVQPRCDKHRVEGAEEVPCPEGDIKGPYQA